MLPLQASSLDFLSDLSSVVLLMYVCVSARIFGLHAESTLLYLQGSRKPCDDGQTT